MNDFSDVLYLTAAMVIYSMLTMNTARSFMNTSDTMIRTDVEYRTIMKAQDEIEQVKLVKREDEAVFNPNSSRYRYKNYPKTVNESFGKSGEYGDTFKVDASSVYIDENDPHVRRYKITVTVVNTSVEPNVEISLMYIKPFER